MPFQDELARNVVVVDYTPSWRDDFLALARRIESALGSIAMDVDHIGSTSVPGLAAKDCIDVQVRVETLDEELLVTAFEKIGFRMRPETWNRVEQVSGIDYPKLVFAPPIGGRASNVHVREATSEAVRRNLLFREFLRDHQQARDDWGAFKKSLNARRLDIYEYGQLKQVPTTFLLIAAEEWAIRTGWTPI